MENFNIVRSGEEDNAEFSIINPNLLEGSDNVSNAPAVATIIYNLYYFLLDSFTKFGLNWSNLTVSIQSYKWCMHCIVNCQKEW